MPKLSIVVGTLDRPKSLHAMIKSIQAYTKAFDWELIISDASIKHPFQQKDFDQYGSDIKLLPEKPRLGHVKGYNKAFRAATGEYVCWLNDDAVVVDGWDNCVGVMDRNQWIGMGSLRFGTHSDNYLSFQYQDLHYANFGILKRELGNKVNWFDEDILYFYGGDNSLAFKVFLSGKPVVPIPGGHVIHRPFTDDYRKDNEAKQAKDAFALMERYRPLLGKMNEVAWKFRERRPI